MIFRHLLWIFWLLFLIGGLISFALWANEINKKIENVSPCVVRYAIVMLICINGLSVISVLKILF